MFRIMLRRYPNGTRFQLLIEDAMWAMPIDVAWQIDASLPKS
jgi:hypothetical protein